MPARSKTNDKKTSQTVPKGQKYFKGFDDRIIAMYARGMSVRDIQAVLLEMYQVDVSEGLISQATEGIMDEVKAWQNRPLDAIYPIIFLDCIVVKCRQDGKVSNVSVYLALGVNTDGHKELLGIWIARTEGAKFWLSVITELQNRDIKDILYTAATEQQAETALDAFAEKWDAKYPMISKSWQTHWQNVIPFFDYPEDIRKAIYTTNAIESLNRSLRKVIKTKGAFPTEASIMKIFYLALANIAKKWTMPIRCWTSAMNQFAIKFADRMRVSAGQPRCRHHRQVHQIHLSAVIQVGNRTRPDGHCSAHPNCPIVFLFQMTMQ